MISHPYLYTLLGGLLVGFAAGVALLANGRVAGISGMMPSVVRPRSADAGGQALLLAGVVAGGMGLAWLLDPAALPVGESAPLQLMIAAGLLVGAMISKTAKFETTFEIIPEATKDTSAEAA